MQAENSTHETSTSHYPLDMMPGEKPLQSWKEIAAYLERDVRTARRWEQAEGLPIRRHRSGTRSSVYAYPSEIEAWRANRKPKVSLQPHLGSWRSVLAALTVLIALVLAASTVLYGPILNPTDPVAEAARTVGMSVRRVWTGPRVDFHGSVSRDGRYVSYVDWSHATGPNLALHDLAEDKDRLLTHNDYDVTPGFPVYSVISPDGEQVAYTWMNNETRQHELRVVPAAPEPGTEPRMVYTNSETPDIRPQAWFPDGKRVLAQISRRDKTNQIVSISLSDGSVEVIKSIEWRWPHHLGLSPDGKNIVYDFEPTQGAGQHDIYLLAADGSRETPLIKHRADEIWADWAPDGRSIFFTSDRAGTVGLWSLAMSGTEPQGSVQLVKNDLGLGPVLTGGLTETGGLYFHHNSSDRNLFLSELDWHTGKAAASPTKIRVQVEGANMKPRWSPDGSRIAYLARDPGQRNTRGRLDLMVHTMTTGKERQFELDFKIQNWMPPLWSPDGSLIMVEGADRRGRRGLYAVDPRSARTHLLLPFPNSGYFANPVWFPDGSAIICREYRDDRSRIAVYSLDSQGEPKTLYSQEEKEVGTKLLAISPDGRWLAFSENLQKTSETAVVRLLPVEGGDSRELIRVPEAGVNFAFDAFSFTPDSRYLIYSRRTKTEEGPKTELIRVSLKNGESVVMGLAGQGLGGLAFRPDSTQVVFHAGQSTRELWAMEGLLPQPGDGK